MTNGDNAVTLVIGLGEVGRPLLTVLQAHDPSAVGVDLEPVAIDRPVGLMHACIPFLQLDSYRRTLIGYARKYRPEVIVVNSTVAPGTTRAIEVATGIPCVYSPVRGKHTKMVEDLKLYVKFVAGADANVAARVQAHFQAAGLKSERLSAPESLELAKLLETTYFGLLIGWAQEMNRFADAVGGAYLEGGRFFSEIGYLPPVLFQPGVIGGHCVMPNIALLEQRYQSVCLDASKSSNEARKAEIQLEEQTERLQPLAFAK